jgi:tetratricopeptide (TPR) repeat protein
MNHVTILFSALSLGSLLVMPGFTASASAQDALGAGNILDNQLGGVSRKGRARRQPSAPNSGYGDALDASLYMGANGVRDLRNAESTRLDFRIGNLMATGSLAGDKNFRGDVGYMAASDFRGEVGSDAIFNELQGSALSQIQFVNSPMANDRYAAGVGIGLYEYRRDYTPAAQIYTVSQASDINQDRIRLDRTNAYAASRNLYDTAVNASSLRLITSESDGEERLLSVESTPLQGIYTRVLGEDTLYSGLSFYDRAALASGLRQGDVKDVGDSFQTPISSIAPESMINGAIIGDIQIGDQADTMINSNILQADPDAQMNAYERVVRELLLRYGDDDSVRLDVNPEILEKVREEMDELRELTMGLDISNAARPTDLDDRDTDRIGSPSLFDDFSDEETDSDAAEEDTQSNRSLTEEEREAKTRADRIGRLGRAAELLRNGTDINSFSEGQLGRIKQLMTQAEMRLKEKDYFDAESRFDRVLRINPGNPLALYGRANAQLGAGLYLSSALSLRKLFTSYPELIGSDLAPQFLPSETRLRLSLAKLRDRFERRSDLPSYGLCYAYVGHLLDEPETISVGLEYMEELESDQLLAELLRQVWIDESSTEEPPGK